MANTGHSLLLVSGIMVAPDMHSMEVYIFSVNIEASDPTSIRFWVSRNTKNMLSYENNYTDLYVHILCCS